MTHKRADIELFVECLFNQYSHILLIEEHITRTDKLKGYREYENGDEVKRELADMLERFVTKYESNDYVCDVRFHASNKEGLSNYIDVTFNAPFGAKEWLKHMSIRASDHYQRKSKKKVDEYIDLNGKTVSDIEKDLDRIINKRIRRLEREFNAPMAQNESLRGKRIMKLKINESSYNHKKYNLISEEEYNHWFNIGVKSFNKGDKCIPVRNKELMKYYQEHNAKIGSIESKKTSQITDAWIDGWTFANIVQEF